MKVKNLLTNTLTVGEAEKILRETDITDDDICTWIPECSEPAVRLAVFQSGDSKKRSIAYLCERHKKMGQSSNNIWSLEG